MNFVDDFAAILRSILSQQGITVRAKYGARDVMHGFYNWQHRRVSAVPRRIECSKAFAVPDIHKKGYERLCRAITSGEDLSPWLSRNSKEFLCSDGMLNDWGVQHLHFSVKGTNELIYVVFDEQCAYFIKVYAHESWANPEVLELLHTTWPHLTQHAVLNGVVGSKHGPYTEPEIKALREKRIGPPMPMPDGKVLSMPGGGQMGRRGTPFRVLRYTDALITELQQLEGWAKGRLSVWAAVRRVPVPEDVTLLLLEPDLHLYVCSSKTGALLPIPVAPGELSCLGQFLHSIARRAASLHE